VPAEPTAVATAPSPALGLATLVTWLLTAGLGAFMLSRLIASGGLRQQRATRGGLSPAVLFGHFSLAGTGLAVWACYVATGWVALAWSAVGLLMPAIGLGISTVTLWTPYPRPGRAAAAGPHADPGGGRPAGGVPGWPSGGVRGVRGWPEGGVAGGPADRVRARQLTDEVWARALTDDVLASQLVDQVIASVPAHPSLAGRRSREHLAAIIPAGHGMAAVATFALAVITAAGGTR
jgi:manganese efflux pump family protein